MGAEAAEAEAGAGAGGMRGLGAAYTWKRAVTNAAEALLLLLLRGGEFEEGMATQEEKEGEKVSPQEGCPGAAVTTRTKAGKGGVSDSPPEQVTLVASPREGGAENVTTRGAKTVGQDTIAGVIKGGGGGGGVGLRVA